MSRIILLLAVSFFCFCNISAQVKHSFRGVVADSNGSPIEFGVAALFSLPDSVFTGHSSIDSGAFKFTEIPEGNYLLKISCIGFEERLQNITVPVETALNIMLASKFVVTKELEVTAYRNPFSNKNGNIKVTLENTVFSTIPDIIEILSKLPTVQVSADRQSINIIGKGSPLIYLDNQRITLNDLSSLSVNDIEHIEIINNPSARYEAEGQVVIQITRKINNTQGSKIDITETASAKRFFENRTGVYVSIKRRKTEYKANLQYQHINRWEGIDGTFSSPADNYYTTFGATSIGPRKIGLAGLGIYRQLKEYNYFSANVNVRFQEEPFKVNTGSYLEMNGTNTTVETRNAGYSRRPYLNVNLNYLKKLTSSSKAFIGGQYSHYERFLGNTIYNNFNNTQLLLSEQREQNYKVDVAVARIDIETQVNKNLKWENGGIVNWAKANTLFTINNVAVAENAATVYNYNESDQALYSQVSGSLKKTTYSAGLRIENTDLQGGYKDSAKLLLNRKFFYLFPKVNISIPLDSALTLTVNFSRNINRPQYAYANQITNYINPFFEFSNNININPGLLNEFSVNLQYKNYSFRAEYYFLKNPTYFINEHAETQGKLRMINQNLASEEGASFMLTLPYQHKNFTSSNTIIANISRINDPRATGLRTAPYYHVYSSNQLRLPNNYTLALIGWITTKRFEGIFERSQQFAVDFSITKTFKKGLSVTLNAFDIFRSLDNKEKFTINGINSNSIFHENVREFSIAIKYSIGKIADAKFKNRDVNDNENRLN